MLQVNLEEAAEGLPDEYGKVENRFRIGFNKAYFEQLCSDEGALSRGRTQLVLTALDSKRFLLHRAKLPLVCRRFIVYRS